MGAIGTAYATATLVVVSSLFGLATGSFLNVVIYRVPRGISVVHPGSMCPTCGTPIKPYDNVPVVSWLLLKGRCRKCRVAISPRYILIEAGTSVSFGALVWSTGLSPATTPLLLLLSATLIAASSVSADGFAIPTALWIPTVASALALVALSAHNHPVDKVAWVAGGVVATGGVSLVYLRLITNSSPASPDATKRATVSYLPELLIALSLGSTVSQQWWPGGVVLAVSTAAFLLTVSVARNNKTSGKSSYKAMRSESSYTGLCRSGVWLTYYLWALSVGALAVLVVGPHLNH